MSVSGEKKDFQVEVAVAEDGVDVFELESLFPDALAQYPRDAHGASGSDWRLIVTGADGITDSSRLD